MSGRRGLLLAGSVAALLAALTASASVGGSALGTSASGTKVRVKEKEWGMAPAPARVRAGKVTFIVADIGKLSHEFVVLRTNRPAKALPVKGPRAVEIGRQGKIPEFKPGQSRTLTLTLRPGRYVLICNLPAHYKAGQFASFSVG